MTLSLPSASYTGDLDVVFVLDGSTSTDEKGLVEQAANLLESLLDYENLTVKAGVVIFGGSNPILYNSELSELDTEICSTLIKEMTDTDYGKNEEGHKGYGCSGSNLQAGVEIARGLLNGDSSVDVSDKYMIILSDGAARMWYENNAAMSQTYTTGSTIFWNSNEDWIKRYDNSGYNVSDAWTGLEANGVTKPVFSEIWSAGQNDTDIGNYGMTEDEKNSASPDDSGVASWKTVATDPDYYTTYEAACYYAATSIVEASNESNVIMVTYPYHSERSYGEFIDEFKDWLENCVTRYESSEADAETIFASVKDDLIQLVDAGSTVVDVIGKTDEYDFDFVDDAEKISLTVGDVTYTTTKVDATNENETSCYTFTSDGVTATNGAQAPFVLHYYKDGTTDISGECFVWDINVPVTKDQKVQLTYTVKLMNPSSVSGTYGTYDNDGSEGYNGLYTNNSATLNPVDSNGDPGTPEDFQKPTVSYEILSGTTTDWDYSKSKEATNLEKDSDDNYYSDVTLSLPSAQESLVSDVVFVLDKSTSNDTEDNALAMLRDLKTQVESVGAQVKVGVVIFNKIANVTDFMDLTTEYDKIESAITQTISGGTNMQAGLLAAKEMLKEDTEVENSRKYMILVSDGLSYYFCQEEDYNKAYTIALYDSYGGLNSYTGIECWNAKYEDYNFSPDSWKAWMGTVSGLLETTDYEQYVYEVDSEFSTGVPYDEIADYPINADLSLYYSSELYSELANTYRCYAVYNGTSAYKWGTTFMNYLSDGETVSFEEIEDNIIYLLDKGSTVVDYIGYVAGTDGYNFDFVDDAAYLTLTVGAETYAVTEITEGLEAGETSQYGFGNVIVSEEGETYYPFVLHYYAGEKLDDEYFVWDINVPISNFVQVQLTYRVILTNPQTTAGTYGVYDQYGDNNDGSAGYDLYTNNSATLYPVDTNGNEGDPEDFQKPTVEYTVENSPTAPTDPTTPTDPTDPTTPDEEEETGDLTVTKVVTGSGGSTTKEFTFKVTLDDTSINGTYGDMTFTDGVATFTLKSGESKTATGLPAGIGYTVTETAASGYTTSVDGTTTLTSEGTIESGSTITVTFTNYKAKSSSSNSGNGGGSSSSSSSSTSGTTAGSSSGPGVTSSDSGTSGSGDPGDPGDPASSSDADPLTALPKTGDNGMNTAMFTLLFGMVAVAYVILSDRRKEKEN
ncbi:MAG: VWA domain-containing protein [Clostridiales bacterium]|nr:VWA domain-containing protein [Clostridiales bacterium]